MPGGCSFVPEPRPINSLFICGLRGLGPLRPVMGSNEGPQHPGAAPEDEGVQSLPGPTRLPIRRWSPAGSPAPTARPRVRPATLASAYIKRDAPRRGVCKDGREGAG